LQAGPPAMNLRPWAKLPFHVAVLPCLLSSLACLSVDNEIVDVAHSVRLCGAGFVVEASGSRPEESMKFRWHEAGKAYVDTEGKTFVRFGRLQGDTYVGQVLALEERAGTALPKRRYLVGLVDSSERPLRASTRLCEEQQGLARGYGLESGPGSSAEAVPMTGPRSGVIGLLAATARCKSAREPFPLFSVQAQSVNPGGPELVTLGAHYDPDLFATPLRMDCEAGKVLACADLGHRYEKGLGVPVDAARAATHFEKACDSGHPVGCEGLAERFERGDGRARDLEAARRLYHKACDGGEPFACEQLRRVGH
jgi:hypothetical protein